MFTKKDVNIRGIVPRDWMNQLSGEDSDRFEWYMTSRGREMTFEFEDIEFGPKSGLSDLKLSLMHIHGYQEISYAELKLIVAMFEEIGAVTVATASEDGVEWDEAIIPV